MAEEKYVSVLQGHKIKDAEARETSEEAYRWAIQAAGWEAQFEEEYAKWAAEGGYCPGCRSLEIRVAALEKELKTLKLTAASDEGEKARTFELGAESE